MYVTQVCTFSASLGSTSGAQSGISQCALCRACFETAMATQMFTKA